ncbi:unnamed protein product [Bemisia tabaci]|uniref:WW domain-containing protein n=1 Tax=Bemisia tabaci TaxID=7038 RepID=A0A9N9ZYK7_BEMTA|nr:PREDICTED: polyglutamine-binding protein 1 [Bemisia tabaci]CAH0382322.1 unnamed protein product [Bemisia tabaci]
MPLPPALAARLSKRGIVPQVTEEKPKPTVNKDDEEIIAEDYDDLKKKEELMNSLKHSYENSDEGEKSEDEEMSDSELVKRKFKGYPGCPNKCNIYHECTKFCEENWGEGHIEPDLRYLHRRKLLLEKYPLPSNWREIFDPGVGKFYYWDYDTDNVSWLPPLHPKAVISESAAHIREERYLAAGDKADDDEGDDDKQDDNNSSDSESDDGSLHHSSPSEDSEESDTEERLQEEKRRKIEEHEKARARGRTKKKHNDIDPMDPAAYSDIPRGKWTDGLNRNNEAKTGVDVTVSGPLFQQRPYPSPGAVLRANAGKKESS